jgi:hypothetical protein
MRIRRRYLQISVMDPNPLESAFLLVGWIRNRTRIRIDEKCWIRIPTETNADPPTLLQIYNLFLLLVTWH